MRTAISLLTVGLCLTAQVATAQTGAPASDGRYKPELIERIFANGPTIVPTRLIASPSGRKAILLWGERTGPTVTKLTKIEVLDVRTGAHRAMAVPAKLSVRDATRISWDPSELRFATVQADGGRGRHFLVWRVDAPDAAPSSVELKPLQGRRVLCWSWMPNDDLVLAAMKQDSLETNPLKPDYDTSKNWAWYWSREIEARRKARAKVQVGTLSLERVSTRTGTAVLGSPPFSFPVPNDLDSGCQSWTFDRQRQSVLFSVRDPRWGDTPGPAEYRNHLAAQPGAKKADAATRLFEWWPRSNRLRLLTSGGPGAIVDPMHMRGADALIYGEEEPQWSAWPAEGRWQHLRILKAGKSPAVLEGEPLELGWPVLRGTGDRIYIHASPARDRLYEVDTGSGAVRDILPADMAATSFSVSEDGNLALALLENAATPPSVFRYERQTGRWEPVGAPTLPTVTGLHARMEYYHWKSKDGRFTLGGVLVKPRDFDPSRRYPLVVDLAGQRMATKATFQNVYYPMIGEFGVPAEVLADAGYVVFYPNHRGSANIDAEMAKALVGHAGDHYDLDVDAGVDELIREGWIDPERLAIMGASAGSEVVGYAISHTNRYKAAIVNDGPLLMPEIGGAAMQDGDATLLFSGQAAAEYLGFNPYARRYIDPDRIRTPLLMRWDGRQTLSAPTFPTHPMKPMAMNEGFDALAQTDVITAAMTMNHVPVDVILDRDGHGVTTAAYRYEFITRAMNWLDYFVRGQGRNPLPVSDLAIDYGADLKRIHGGTSPAP